MNVLGAMFFKTYEDVQAESYEIWQKLRVELIMEYEETPPVVPPFVLLWNILLVVRMCFSRCARVQKLLSFLDIKGSGNFLLQFDMKFSTSIA